MKLLIIVFTFLMSLNVFSVHHIKISCSKKDLDSWRKLKLGSCIDKSCKYKISNKGSAGVSYVKQNDQIRFNYINPELIIQFDSKKLMSLSFLDKFCTGVNWKSFSTLKFYKIPKQNINEAEYLLKDKYKDSPFFKLNSTISSGCVEFSKQENKSYVLLQLKPLQSAPNSCFK